MNTPDDQRSETGNRQSALFQALVAQQVNLALICLGQAPGEDGQKSLDLESARFFIDMLEMLEAKTTGQLNQREQAMLAQNLTSLRLLFVQISNADASARAAPASPPASYEPAPAASAPAAETGESAQPGESESRKKYTKKY